jgi:hypothetical protein
VLGVSCALTVGDSGVAQTPVVHPTIAPIADGVVFAPGVTDTPMWNRGDGLWNNGEGFGTVASGFAPDLGGWRGVEEDPCVTAATSTMTPSKQMLYDEQEIGYTVGHLSGFSLAARGSARWSSATG